MYVTTWAGLNYAALEEVETEKIDDFVAIARYQHLCEPYDHIYYYKVFRYRRQLRSPA